MTTQPTFTDPNWQIVSNGDRTGDGNDDILWQNINDQSLVLWTQDGATTTATVTLPSETGYEVVATGDLDGDGKADYLMEQSTGGARKVLMSGTGTIEQYDTGSADWKVRASTDVSNDNKDDVIWYNTATQNLWVGVMDGTTRTDFATFASGYAGDDTLQAAYAGTDKDDFRALWYDDSGLDFELATYTDGVLSVNDSFFVNPGNAYKNSGDYDGDGYIDHMFRDDDPAGGDEGSVSVIFTSSGNLEAARYEYDNVPPGQTPQATIINFESGGDVDGDGTSELVRVDNATGERSTYNVQGGRTWNDTLIGSDQNDAMDGADGDDRLFGRGGNDLLVGDNGDDLIMGGDGDDYIDGENGNDSLFGGNGNDEILTGSGQNYAQGGAGDDRIIQESTGSITEGGTGDDYMQSIGSAQQRGGEGNDVIVSLSGRAMLEGGDGDDQLFGSNYTDYIYGGDGDDYLEGGDGTDTLWGGNGDDVLIGVDKDGASTTNDVFYGGSGKDYFVLGTATTTYYAGSGFAVIKDYFASNASTSGDHLVLQGAASDYTYTDTGPTIQVRLASTANLIAQLETTASASAVADTAIYLG